MVHSTCRLPFGLLWTLATLLGLAIVPGCGDSGQSSIHGTITLDGVPVPNGTIAFVPARGTSAPMTGGEFKDGKYSIGGDKGLVPGKYVVEIKSPQKTGKTVVVYAGEEPGEEIAETIPAKYNERSTLEVEISLGRTEKDFELTSGD